MPLENNLQRKRIGLPNDTYQDDMEAGEEKEPLNNIIKLGIAGAGMYGLYKKGLLKPFVKGFVEVAQSIASNGLDKSYLSTEAIKKWSNINHLTPDLLEDMGYKLPEHSLFRGSNFDKLKQIGSSLKTGMQSGNLNFNLAKKIINDTANDMNILKQMIDDNQSNLENLQRTFYNTDLITGIKEMRKFSKEIVANSPDVQIMARSKAAEVFIEKNKLSREAELKMMKQNGFRQVMLQDIIKKPIKNKDGKVILETLENAPIDLYDGLPHQSGNSMFYLQSIIDNPDYRYLRNGKPTSMLGDWDNVKRLVVDKNLLIDEQGKLIDLRMSNKMKSNFLKSLATDFKIPGLNFNPLATLFPSWGRGDIRQATFGVLSKNDMQPFITKTAGRVTLGDKIGSDVLVFNGEGYKVVENGLEKVADNIVLHDISRAGAFEFSKTISSTRKMAGLEYYEYKLKDGEIPKKLDNIFKAMDMGKNDTFNRNKKKFNVDDIRLRDIEDTKDFNSYSNIEDKIDSFISNITDKANIYNTKEYKVERTAVEVFGEGPSKIQNEFDTEDTRRFIATIKGTNFSDIKEQEGIKGKVDFTKNYINELFTAGRQKDGTMNDNFTENTLKVFGLFDSVFERFGSIASPLAFSTASKGNTFDYIKNVALKRVLPIYGLTQVPGMLNYMSEPIFQLLGMNDNEDGTDNKMNINKFVASEVVKPVDIGFHKVKDFLGITKLMKKIEEFTPGFDQINELPGVYSLGLTQTEEERKEYIQNGMDPVRKGRYWGMGNTPFTGGKIMYWRPNMYRRVAADVDFSDSKWGSRQEYYNNTWYPNPVNPLAPLNHFIFDRNHYDKKHYYDRPYLLTSTEGSNIPIVGPLISSTVGSIGQKRMHEEYWQDGHPMEYNDESVALIDYIKQATTYQRQSAVNSGFINREIISSVNKNLQSSQAGDAQSRQIAVVRSKEMVNTPLGTGFMSYSDITGDQLSSTISPYEIYTTPSGGMQLVDIPSTLTTWNANQELRKYSIKRIPTADSRINVNDNKYNPQLADYSNEKINNRFLYGIGDEFNTLSDLFGMKGFEMQTFITGKANEDARTIEDSSYAYSFNKSFWDENMGGLGGEASEIFRRFVQRRDTNSDFIDPIRNTMPSWMPGRSYFTDFKHGDPYSKVPNGEERLPGEGYERLYGINTKELFQLRIGSSFIGRTKEEMMKHLLNQDNLDSFGQDVTEEGTKMHSEIEKAWTDAGIAFSTEGKIEDKENHILGFYDAEVHDLSSPTGVGIVDIKTVGQKKFNKVMKEQKPLYEHQSQVNYYLWATGNTKSNGYIYYVNRDNPEQTLTLGFKFNQDLLEQNLNTLAEARKTISGQIQSGQLGRGELYNPLDRFRILADVAPYSDEFAQLKAILANDSQLSDAQQKEISEIKERVTKQKEPLRVYPYKFKTANLKNEDVTVKKLIDNNTLLVDRYGVEHAIKLAGIHVSESNSEKYNETLSMNDAATKELRKFFKKGKHITINYDADDANKFKKDSTESIRAVIYSNGKNVNKWMLNKGLAKEKDDDDSPAAIHARYSNNEILVGGAMESITHFIAQMPFIGNKLLQVKSPYEQYRDREVYGKDFQSWNHPIKDFLVPELDKISSTQGPGAIFLGAFIGSLFGKSKYGKIIGGTLGATIASVGKINAAAHKTKDKDWVPERRQKQSELNEYFDTLKYVKNMSLYEKYRKKALLENHIDVTEFEDSKMAGGVYNKNRSRELKDFKKTVKLDFKHRGDYDFKYGSPKYVDMKADKKTIISQINQELNEIQSDRSIERAPDNVIKALSYKQMAAQTMYGYEQGDPLQNLMTALPKKERQYLKYFMKSPEEEKQKILRIAPEYLRRGLQQAWGMEVDEKPSLQEYFRSHGLPDASWLGWNEDTNIEDVKVKLVHNNKLDMGEFDLWDEQIDNANKVDIPIPKIHSQNSSSVIQSKLRNILGKMGYDDVTVSHYQSANGNRNTLDVHQDSRDDIADKIYQMNV